MSELKQTEHNKKKNRHMVPHFEEIRKCGYFQKDDEILGSEILQITNQSQAGDLYLNVLERMVDFIKPST